MYAVRARTREMDRGLTARRSLAIACLLAVRVLAVLLSVEFSGLPHAVMDGVEAFAGHEQHAGDDCGDEGGHECPPGCPDCHCWQAGLPSELVQIVADIAILPRPVREASFASYRRVASDNTRARSVYRPPRG